MYSLDSYNCRKNTMIDIIKTNQDKILELCRRYNVKRLEIFGSTVTGDFDGKSDIDFLVEFLPLRRGQYADTYFNLLEDIKVLLDREVDLVMTKAIKNQYFLKQINKQREVLYAS